MNNYTFEGKLKSTLIGFMVIGLVSMIITFMGDDALHTRFWTNFLHNSLFFTGISLMAVFTLAAFILAWAGWYTGMKRVWESMVGFLVVGMVLMLILAVGNYMGFHSLYHWNDAQSLIDDKVLLAKSFFLNKGAYIFGTIITIGFAWFVGNKFRSLSRKEENDEENSTFKYHHKMRVYSGLFLPIFGYASVLMLWLWLMSLDAHWYSTLYAWKATVSWFVSMIAMTILILIYLQSKGYYKNITTEHYHDLGKFLFAFSIFWTYMWFSEYMLIWYSNNGEETGYFFLRRNEYNVLWTGNVIINFVLPFIVLLPNSTKRYRGLLVFMSIVLFFGHWIDYFLMIKPGALHTAHALLAASVEHGGHAVAEHGGHGHSSFTPGFTLPGLVEIGTFIGFLGLFLFVFFTNLAKTTLVSKKDPYYEESLHHHVM